MEVFEQCFLGLGTRGLSWSFMAQSTLLRSCWVGQLTTSCFDWADLVILAVNQYFVPIAGVILELSEREKFCDNSRISGRSFSPIFGFPYIFYTFSLLPVL